jgi:hypothetical protein
MYVVIDVKFIFFITFAIDFYLIWNKATILRKFDDNVSLLAVIRYVFVQIVEIIMQY